jgi:hypothetical protein
MATTYKARDNVRLARRCKRCGNWIHAPASVQVMLGPRCRGHERAERDQRRRDEQWALIPESELRAAS